MAEAQQTTINLDDDAGKVTYGPSKDGKGVDVDFELNGKTADDVAFTGKFSNKLNFAPGTDPKEMEASLKHYGAAAGDFFKNVVGHRQADELNNPGSPASRMLGTLQQRMDRLMQHDPNIQGVGPTDARDHGMFKVEPAEVGKTAALDSPELKTAAVPRPDTLGMG